MGGREALVVTYLLVFSISYMSENVRKIHLRPHLSLYHTETSAFLWQRPWILELEYDRKVILLQICSTKQGLSLHKICVKCLTQVKLNRAFRPNSSTHNTKKNHHHHCCKLKQCGTLLRNMQSNSPRERIYFEQINPLVLLSFQDSNAKITPYLPILFQYLVSGEIELREDHNKTRWLSLIEQIQFLMHKYWGVKLSCFQSLLRVLKFFSSVLHFEVAPHEYPCQTILTLHLLTVSSFHRDDI